ncbi:XAP5-domain-containing protein [Terfezia boudieri ATCC MYA-4762]|uniref:XAP5-domain-containing protein n=1 Tax=Terfezia boudieri ATCC MYA-4762 TaxID=1051890 RepID=A0A3N4LLQ7_9PEZI|nr:XAP5-domain-containing protein [Terfezia boudieri ATCC MYA-4762]
MSNPPSTSASGTTTPTSRFTKTTETLEDVLKTQTVGLVHLSEFKKRRVQLLEKKEREAHERGRIGIESTLGSTNGTPQSSGSETGVGEKPSKKSGQPPRKKRKAGVSQGKLSFAQDDEEEADQAGDREAEDSGAITDASTSKLTSGKPFTSAEPASLQPSTTASRSVSTTPEPLTTSSTTKPRPNPNLPHPPPKLLTKSSLRREAHERELLRREFLSLQERIKNEEILIPFVFYDGTNVTPREPGVRVKKGDPVWLFLERARRMSGRREWLRVSVDDLLLVRGEVIIPHHYEFYYFLVNRTEGPNGLLFDYPSPLENANTIATTTNTSTTSANGTAADKDKDKPTLIIGTEEGSMTKVVDRRWYERNKHIFPASVWTNFDPAKDYKGMVRRDRDNNAFFFG